MTKLHDPAFLSLYEPLDTLKPVAEDIWIVDGPAIRMSFPLGISVPFTTRMTVVRLSDGTLWLHSPTRLVPSLQDELAGLGEVRYLISPNFIHYASIPAWAEAYPAATSWASPGVRERAETHHIVVQFDQDLQDAPDAAWADDVDQHLFAGSDVLREVVFFHKKTRTLILTDLIENFEPHKVACRWRPLLYLAGNVDPDGKAPFDMRSTFRRRDEARTSLKRLLAWNPERVILSHGRWYDKDGAEELRRAFRWLR